MPDHRRTRCTCCGKHRDEVGEITWRGNCIGCAQLLVAENAIGISRQQGWPHIRRLRGMAAYLERQYLDAVQAKP